MFQDFTVTSRPDQGPPRLAKLRARFAAHGLDGFLVPRADAHQGEYVAPCDERLAWLTGFTGSAGFAAVLADTAGVFVDGRYRVQVRDQVADVFTPVDWPEVSLAAWLRDHMPDGGVVGFDPWLHTPKALSDLAEALAGSQITLRPCVNLVDEIWADRPAPPTQPAFIQPIEFAGKSHEGKRANIAEHLIKGGYDGALITLPDSLCWLLNIRGADIEHTPIMQGFAMIHRDARVDVFAAPAKLSALAEHLGTDVRVHPVEDLVAVLGGFEGRVLVDATTAPVALTAALSKATIGQGSDPCALPKACKTPHEIKGMQEAHLRDGAAMCEFLAWFDAQIPDGAAHGDRLDITEIDVVKKLEECRRATGLLREISFDTIAGTGPNGAVIHYRVNEDSNRALCIGDLLVLDSGGQYQDGTTDITRTLPVGPVGAEERAAFTRVLQGMINVSMLRFPVGLAGRDIESVGRLALWQAGQDFDHGLGHGVGAYLSVHEGPMSLSKRSHIALAPGMILSNEPGYYRAGAFGIRIENLVVVREADAIAGGDARAMLGFETLTYVPIDPAMIVPDMLSAEARAWLATYHQTCRDKIGPLLSAQARLWLDNKIMHL